MSDLVSYLFARDGDMAELRQRDGHPTPYKPETTWFELGNEIDNTNYVSQALAMETRAKSLGIGGVLKYACPSQCGIKIIKEGFFFF
jgi:alpha-L-arabinofuranosidase